MMRFFNKKDDASFAKVSTPKAKGLSDVQRMGAINKEIPKTIRPENFRKMYEEDPILRTFIDFPCYFIVKSGFEIVGGDDESREKVIAFFENFNSYDVLFQWIKDSRVYGFGGVEFLKPSGDFLGELRPRSAEHLTVEQDDHGRVIKIFQTVGMDKTEFASSEMFLLYNSPMPIKPYGISVIESIAYLVRELKDPAERDMVVMLNKYAGERFEVTVGREGQTVSSTKITEVQNYFNGISANEDIIHAGDIKIDMLKPLTTGVDFRSYLDYIILELSMGANVPLVFWYGTGSTEATAKIQMIAFDAYIKGLQKSIEWTIDEQVIKGVVPGAKKYPKFKFKSEMLLADAGAEPRKMPEIEEALNVPE